jgi:hypothetical protein
MDMTPTSIIYWNQQESSYDEVIQLKFLHYDDYGRTGMTFNSVKCTGQYSPFLCQAVMPLFPEGKHKIAISASNKFGESMISPSVEFNFKGGKQIPSAK